MSVIALESQLLQPQYTAVLIGHSIVIGVCNGIILGMKLHPSDK